MVDGALRPAYAGVFSSIVLACSTAGTEPLVATLNPSSGNAAAAAPAGQRPRAGTVASCAQETTPAGIAIGGLPGKVPRLWNVPGMVSFGSARTTTTPWTPGIPRSRAASGAAGAA